MNPEAEQLRGAFVANIRAGKAILIGDAALLRVAAVHPDAVLLDVTEQGQITRRETLVFEGVLELESGRITLEMISGLRAKIVIVSTAHVTVRGD